MSNWINKVNDNIEENTLIKREDPFEIGWENVVQNDKFKEEIKENFEVLDNKISEVWWTDKKDLIFEIIWQKWISFIDLQIYWRRLSKITREELEKIRDNKDLISEITRWASIDISDLESLNKITREELEKIRNNMDLISEITWWETIDVGYLESFSKITRKELEEIRNNKDLISEITWWETIDAGNLVRLNKIPRKELENFRDNKDLIFEIIWQKWISVQDLFSLYLKWKKFGKITREELEKIRANKDLILEITWCPIHVWNLQSLSKITKKGLEKVKNNKDLILEVSWRNSIDISDLKSLSKTTRKELEELGKNMDLIEDILWWMRIDSGGASLKTLSTITRKELEKIKNNKNLIEDVMWYIMDYDLKYLSKVTKQELEVVKKNKNLILYISGRFDIESNALSYLGKITREDLVEVIKNKELILKITWKGRISTDLDNPLNVLVAVKMSKIIKNSNIIKMKNYVKRKQEYLEKNRLIDDHEFKRLFRGSWKYWKWEIGQTDLKLCYFYTIIELLKKTNFFEVLIKTNLKKSEDWEWWCVRLPFCDENWVWITVFHSEIDKEFDIHDKKWLREWASINSHSPEWFKILEIAYMKKFLIDKYKNIKQEFLNTWNVALSWDRIASLEGRRRGVALQILMWKDNIIQWFNPNEIDCNIIFDNFGQWLMVDLGVKKEEYLDDKLKINKGWEKEVFISDVKIIGKNNNISAKEKLLCAIFETEPPEPSDVVRLKDGRKWVIFCKNHSYSIEKCYIDKQTWAKRVLVVNPWHTWMKFDISLETAEEIFDWRVSYVDFDKLFR